MSLAISPMPASSSMKICCNECNENAVSEIAAIDGRHECQEIDVAGAVVETPCQCVSGTAPAADITRYHPSELNHLHTPYRRVYIGILVCFPPFSSIMVRNVGSRQSLRESMADLNVSSSSQNPSGRQSDRNAQQAGINVTSVAGVKCDSCASAGQTMWLLPGRNCPLCGKPPASAPATQPLNSRPKGKPQRCTECLVADRTVWLLPGYPCPICAKPEQQQGQRATAPNVLEESKKCQTIFPQATRENAAKYTKPFCDFLTDNPTVFHAVDALKKDLKEQGFTQLSERNSWEIKPSGKYFVERNGSSLIAFIVGANYEPGNGTAILAGHVDALTAKLKPVSQVPNKAGFLQLGVAPYAGGLGHTWWDRDLGIGGRVHIKEGDKIVTKLVKLDWPIAKIPSLAEHFGAPAQGPFNKETQMVPVIGLDSSDSQSKMVEPHVEPFSQPSLLGRADGSVGSFISTQPPALVSAIAKALDLNTNSYANIVNWELELFDVQPATVAGLNKEFISAGRIDDKLCSWAALQALIEAHDDTSSSSIIKVVGLFDDEEIGSLLRQGAKGNFLPITLERAVGSLAGHKPDSDLMGRTMANSFMVSSDVTHAVNPNFLSVYLENHAPHLNVGVAIAADSNGHMTTDSVSTTILKRCADNVGAQLQVFQIRNDSRSGGTVGPMLSSALGVRAIDAGLAQLSMHSIRATTGALDPGLGVIMFLGFLNGFESVDKELQDS